MSASILYRLIELMLRSRADLTGLTRVPSTIQNVIQAGYTLSGELGEVTKIGGRQHSSLCTIYTNFSPKQNYNLQRKQESHAVARKPRDAVAVFDFKLTPQREYDFYESTRLEKTSFIPQNIPMQDRI